MTAVVTIGVPVYRGEKHLTQALESIQAQTCDDWQVVISIDGPDPVCERICSGYLGDPRFVVSIRPQRLGWARNIEWLQQQADGEFWYYHQQDDLVDPTYLEVLIETARGSPDTAVVYADIETFGTRETTFTQQSVIGRPLDRQLALLGGHFAGVAFRGLTRVAALRDTGGGIVPNDRDDFAVDVVWMAVMATWGDLIRVPDHALSKAIPRAQFARRLVELGPARRAAKPGLPIATTCSRSPPEFRRAIRSGGTCGRQR